MKPNSVDVQAKKAIVQEVIGNPKDGAKGGETWECDWKNLFTAKEIREGVKENKEVLFDVPFALNTA